MPGMHPGGLGVPVARGGLQETRACQHRHSPAVYPQVALSSDVLVKWGRNVTVHGNLSARGGSEGAGDSPRKQRAEPQLPGVSPRAESSPSNALAQEPLAFPVPCAPGDVDLLPSYMRSSCL